MTHELKTWPEYFEKVFSGEKQFEIRKNDRHFKTGDTLVLKEWEPIDGYTGREITKLAGYIFNGGGTMGLVKGYVIIQLKEENRNYQPSFYEAGLTKRELFAMAAMQGICAGPVDTHTLGAELTVKVAKAAIKIADELLKQLES